MTETKEWRAVGTEAGRLLSETSATCVAGTTATGGSNCVAEAGHNTPSPSSALLSLIGEPHVILAGCCTLDFSGGDGDGALCALAWSRPMDSFSMATADTNISSLSEVTAAVFSNLRSGSMNGFSWVARNGELTALCLVPPCLLPLCTLSTSRTGDNITSSNNASPGATTSSLKSTQSKLNRTSASTLGESMTTLRRIAREDDLRMREYSGPRDESSGSNASIVMLDLRGI